MDCIFCKIISGAIPAEKVYEDSDCIVIKDINPVASKHYLLIPKQHYKFLAQMNDEQSKILGQCLQKTDKIAALLSLKNGFRLVINQGEDAQQTVPHLHIHILGGQKMGWNPA